MHVRPWAFSGHNIFGSSFSFSHQLNTKYNSTNISHINAKNGYGGSILSVSQYISRSMEQDNHLV